MMNRLFGEDNRMISNGLEYCGNTYNFEMVNVHDGITHSTRIGVNFIKNGYRVNEDDVPYLLASSLHEVLDNHRFKPFNQSMFDLYYFEWKQKVASENLDA